MAVNPKFTYAKVKINNEYLILAKERMKESKIEGEIVKEFKGEELIGLEYEPLYPVSSIQYPVSSIYKVIPAGFVSLEEGTGFVHIAPAFGEEDLSAFRQQIPNSKFQIPKPVDEEGKMKTPGYKWDRIFVKDADPLIIEDLKKRNLLFKKESYEHDYPFCWRCDCPLIYYAKKSWFIKTTKIKKELLKNNQKINWIPSYLKEGRFGEWLREVKDWAFSRERYWGTPLPIWRCKKCDHLEIIGSRKDLFSQKFSTNKYFILRHGETSYQTKNKDIQIIYPWPESPPILLTEKGKKKIKEAAKKLKNKKIDLIYSSDISRTRQTAEIIAKELDLKINFDSRLRDINVGIYNGRPKKEYLEYFSNRFERFSKRPSKGENWNDCKKRMIDFLKDINRKYQKKTILIVSHADPLWLLEGTMRGLTNEELLEQKYKKIFLEPGHSREIDYKEMPLNQKGEIDFHRPYIDEMKFECPKCQGLMERVPEVIDSWFDSGAMPFAQGHWPFASAFAKASADKQNQKIKPPELFPADYISEGVDQTRGWFYTLLAISTLLGFGPPYKNVISLGHVLDEKGEKMSKSKGNVVDPWQIIEKYGVDVLRWYFFTLNQPGDSKRFKENEVRERFNKFMGTLWNTYAFFETYVSKKEIPNPKHQIPNKSQILNYKSQNLLDRWIISKLNGLIKEVTDYLDKYDIVLAARTIENFVIDDLSNWYIRRSRKRFHPPNLSSKTWAGKETQKDYQEASETLSFLLFELSKLVAPFIPFLSEEIYKNVSCFMFHVSGFSSVHLSDWPKPRRTLINKKLETQMDLVRKITALGLKARAQSRIKVRQPLGNFQFSIFNFQIKNNLLDLIKDELNVKEVKLVKKLSKGGDWQIESEGKIKIALNIQITPEFREEGIIREVIRNIQGMRKSAGFRPHHKIRIRYSSGPSLGKALTKWSDFIKEETLATSIEAGKKLKKVFDTEKEITFPPATLRVTMRAGDQEKLWLAIKRI